MTGTDFGASLRLNFAAKTHNERNGHVMHRAARNEFAESVGLPAQNAST